MVGRQSHDYVMCESLPCGTSRLEAKMIPSVFSPCPGVLFYCMYPTQNHAHCLQVALNYHADVNNVSQEGNHVFQMMCERAHECTPTCLTMLDEGANPDATNVVTMQQSMYLIIEKLHKPSQFISIIFSCYFSHLASPIMSVQ